MVAKKKHWGAIPASCMHYKYVAQAGKHYGCQWSIWRDPNESARGWVNFRLMVSGGIPGRANYKISWSATQARFSETCDLMDLKEKRPLLFENFCKILAELKFIDQPAVFEGKQQVGKDWDGVNDYKFVANLPKTNGCQWSIYYRPAQDGNEWINFNLCAVGMIEGRANYNFGWNGFRLAPYRELQSIGENRQALLKSFIKKLKSLGFIAADYEYKEKI